MNTRVARGQIAWQRPVSLLLSITVGLVITSLGLPQWVTGPLVNALLVLTALRLGVGQAMILGMVTPLGAALRGVLPLPLVVMIPFIALGNAVLAGVFSGLRRTNEWLALGAAAVAKFAWLFASVTVLVARPLTLSLAGATQSVLLPEAMINMMRWPQLATALAGGVLALSVDGLVRRYARHDQSA